MDDDQFHGNLNVQGGNPEPEETPAQAPAESESEMSRRMNEILGSFDDGIATADAISNGNGQVVQGTAIRADAPRPDFAQQPAAAPVQADVTMATEGAYDPNTGVQANAQQNNYNESSFEASPGATPVMTGTPRSSIEQAAAEEAAREAVAAAGKKISPKIIIIIVVAILLIAAAVVAVAVMMDGGKKDNKKDNNQSQVEPEPEPEPVVETQRIGTADHGYVTVPKEWTRSLDESVTYGGGFGYSDADMNNVVIINSAAISATMTAKNFASGQLNNAIAAKMSQPEMITETHGSYNMYKVFYYDTTTKKWTFKYVFEAEDSRVHYIQVITTDNTSNLVNSVPNSWSVNQNSEGGVPKKEEEKTDADADTDKDSSDAKDQSDSDTDGADDKAE